MGSFVKSHNIRVGREAFLRRSRVSTGPWDLARRHGAPFYNTALKTAKGPDGQAYPPTQALREICSRKTTNQLLVHDIFERCARAGLPEEAESLLQLCHERRDLRTAYEQDLATRKGEELARSRGDDNPAPDASAPKEVSHLYSGEVYILIIAAYIARAETMEGVEQVGDAVDRFAEGFKHTTSADMALRAQRVLSECLEERRLALHDKPDVLGALSTVLFSKVLPKAGLRSNPTLFRPCLGYALTEGEAVSILEKSYSPPRMLLDIIAKLGDPRAAVSAAENALTRGPAGPLVDKALSTPMLDGLLSVYARQGDFKKAYALFLAVDALRVRFSYCSAPEEPIPLMATRSTLYLFGSFIEFAKGLPKGGLREEHLDVLCHAWVTLRQLMHPAFKAYHPRYIYEQYVEALYAFYQAAGCSSLKARIRDEIEQKFAMVATYDHRSAQRMLKDNIPANLAPSLWETLQRVYLGEGDMPSAQWLQHLSNGRAISARFRREFGAVKRRVAEKQQESHQALSA
eukprot:TRINITY_DN72731_c0_g1_i1.p1 TRINITY_DN72731_c0_g1~~TRINITY_DN72731_c0_g1_i1.p1  ORF type:complete len:544 (+),score=124.84 TRINITY_DN72731_c0_g1_i1:84-1634(+)